MKKSQLKGTVLTLILGPIGLFYSSIPAAVTLVAATAAIGFLSSEVPLSFWPISVAVSLIAIRRHNAKLGQKQPRVSPEVGKVGTRTTSRDEEEWKDDLMASRKTVAERLSNAGERLLEEEAAHPFDRPGFVDGHRFTSYVEQVKLLKREERYEEAIALLHRLIAATEAESRESGGAAGVAPWYYEQLAIIYRKERRFADEVAILKRYERQSKAPGVGPQKLADRLTKATKLAQKTCRDNLTELDADLKLESERLHGWQVDLEARDEGLSEMYEDPKAPEEESEPKWSKLGPWNDEDSKTEPHESLSRMPIAGADRIAAYLKEARTKNAESERKESGLADFRIPHGRTYPGTRNASRKVPGRWVQPGETVNVGKFEIQGGFFYFGELLESVRDYDYENDPSLVNPTLEIATAFPDYAGEQMTYWPSYGRVSPQSRAAYIEWLSGDRSTPETYIGYVFLYFYGIERRLLVDDLNGGISDGERRALIKELKRLKNIYGQDRSFGSYAGSLLSHVWAINQDDALLEPEPDILLEKRGFSSAFRLLLARTVQERKPVSGKLALAWVKGHPDFTLRTPARRCPNEFDALFIMRYRSSFGDGIKITPNKIRLQLDYVPASASLRGYPGTKLDLPDVSYLKRPFHRLHILAEACTTELEQYSRYVGKQGNSKDSLRALSLLPNDLIPSLSNPLLESLKVWMGTQISESGGLVPVESILRYAGEGIPPKINKREAEMLARVAEVAGFGVAPDVRFHQAKPDIDGKVVLFAGGHGNSFLPSSEFRKVGTIIRLGSLVAATDDHIGESEVNALDNVIASDRRLTEIEKNSLRAYMMWRLHSPPNLAGLKKRLEHFSATEKVAISHILVGVALADGKVEPSEINQLERLYVRLGLDRAMVTSDIHILFTSRPPRLSREREAAPVVPTEDQTVPESGFSLDRDLLRLLEKETEEAQSVLDSIFSDEDFDEAPEPGFSTAALEGSGTFQDLEAKYQQLYTGLISKEEWSQEELEGLCAGLQLMPGGAIETINDWTINKVGAPLVEAGATVFVDLELAEELDELQEQGQST